MVIRDRSRANHFIRSAKARKKHPLYILKTPFGLAEVWTVDGSAIIVPGWRRSAIVVDWATAVHHIRKHLPRR